MTDQEISHKVTMRPIEEIAKQLGIDPDDLEL